MADAAARAEQGGGYADEGVAIPIASAAQQADAGSSLRATLDRVIAAMEAQAVKAACSLRRPSLPLRPPGSPAMREAYRYQAQTAGISTGPVTGRSAASPALRYDNPNPNGASIVRWDGIRVLPDGSTELYRCQDGNRDIPDQHRAIHTAELQGLAIETKRCTGAKSRRYRSDRGCDRRSCRRGEKHHPRSSHQNHFYLHKAVTAIRWD